VVYTLNEEQYIDVGENERVHISSTGLLVHQDLDEGNSMPIWKKKPPVEVKQWVCINGHSNLESFAECNTCTTTIRSNRVVSERVELTREEVLEQQKDQVKTSVQVEKLLPKCTICGSADVVPTTYWGKNSRGANYYARQRLGNHFQFKCHNCEALF